MSVIHQCSNKSVNIHIQYCAVLSNVNRGVNLTTSISISVSYIQFIDILDILTSDIFQQKLLAICLTISDLQLQIDDTDFTHGVLRLTAFNQ